MEQIVTTDTILEYLKECVEHKRPVDAHTWLDAAQKLTMLLGDEHDKLYELQGVLAQLRAALVEEGAPSTKAKLIVEGNPKYIEMQKQRGKISRIEEMVRIAKIQARMKDNELRSL